MQYTTCKLKKGSYVLVGGKRADNGSLSYLEEVGLQKGMCAPILWYHDNYSAEKNPPHKQATYVETIKNSR